MSIPNLPVDFKDDILSSTNKKRKYTEINNLDGTKSFEDSTEYDQVGSEFGAREVNQTNGAINNIYDERILNVESLELVTEPGFFVDAQAVAELNGNNKVYKWEQTASPYQNGSMTVRIYRIGRSCFCRVSWTGGTLQSGEELIEFLIPQSFRPTGDEIGSCMNVIGTSSAETSTRIIIRSNGKVQFVTNDTRTVERLVSISYLSANAELPGDEYLA